MHSPLSSTALKEVEKEINTILNIRILKNNQIIIFFKSTTHRHHQMLVMATLLLQCVSSLEVLCQACHRFVSLSAFSLLFNNWKEYAIDWDQVTDVGTEGYPIFLPWETLGLILEYALGRYLFTLWTTVRSVFQHLAEFEQRATEHFRINIAIFISSCIIGKHLWSGATGSHTCPCHNISSTTDDMVCFRSQIVLLVLPS